MQEYINEVVKWPAITQGIIGSALFWLILVAGNFISKYSLNHLSLFRKRTRKKILTAEALLCKTILTEDLSFIGAAEITLVFESLRNFYNGVISFILGYMLGGFFGIFLYIGGMFSIYFITLAAVTVKNLHSTDPDEIKKRLAEIDKTIESLERNA